MHSWRERWRWRQLVACLRLLPLPVCQSSVLIVWWCLLVWTAVKWLGCIAILFDLHLSLGISTLNTVLLYLSLFIGAITLAIGRTTLLQGIVHLIIFFEYLFLSLVP